MKADTKTEGAKPGVTFFSQWLDWTNSEVGISASTDNVGISANFGADLFDSSLYVDNWFGWFTVAGFKTTIGNFTSRFSGGFLNKDIHDSNISFMPGSWSLGLRNLTVGKDADNFTRNHFDPNYRNRLAVVGDYTFKFGDEMLVLAKAGIIGMDADRFGDAKLNMQTGYAFEAAFQMPLLTVDALVRVMKANHVSTSAFVTVNPLKAMNFLVGATLGWQEGPEVGYGDDFFAFGVDAGIRFAISDNMAITAQGNFGRTIINSDKEGKKLYKEMKSDAKKAGGEDWKAFQEMDRYTMPWEGGVVLNWTMGINDVFKIYAEGGFKGAPVSNLKADGTPIDPNNPYDYQLKNTIMAQFGAVIKPVANATVVAAIRGSGAPEDGKMTLEIPVSVKVAF